jgi:hypothetical protein
MYNHVTLALKESHPLTYLQDHESLHAFFIDQYGSLQTLAHGTIQPELDFTEEQMIPTHIPNYEEQPEDFEIVPVNAFGVTFL